MPRLKRALSSGRSSSRLFRFDETLRARHQARLLAGMDEAGRGPLAGPVVAAVVVLDSPAPLELDSVRDSKILSPENRERLFPIIQSRAVRWAIGWASHEEIDRINILQASFLAMRRAFVRLGMNDRELLAIVDGPHRVPALPSRQEPVVGGDDLSLCVASAAILAKVVRDRWMNRLHHAYPGYGFASHKGYGTRQHLEALSLLGPSPIHRRSFEPVARLLSNPPQAQ